MSTRYYPIFFKGNPQLRVFLPNFVMKLMKPKYATPSNELQFTVSTEMTKYDVENYLTKIYKVPIKSVRICIHMGNFKREPSFGYIIKEDDYKVAYVTLAKDVKFEFPNLFPEEKKKDFEKDDDVVKQYKARKEKNWERPGIPLWFGV